MSSAAEIQTAKHTPGPWKVAGRAGYTGHSVKGLDGRSVAAFPSFSKRDKAERDANARLIAASPELLTLLRKTVAALAEFDVEEDRALVSEARAAIANAEAQS